MDVLISIQITDFPWLPIHIQIYCPTSVPIFIIFVCGIMRVASYIETNIIAILANKLHFPFPYQALKWFEISTAAAFFLCHNKEIYKESCFIAFT